jgi:nitrogen fixation protein NifU and related proteins
MDDLYHDHLLDHYEQPRCYGRLDQAEATFGDTNPGCGDAIRIDVRLSDDSSTIAAIGFTGDGCVISQAAASMLLEAVQGRPVDDVLRMTGQDVLDLLGVSLTGSRLKCALLALMTLKSGLADLVAHQPAGATMVQA